MILFINTADLKFVQLALIEKGKVAAKINFEAQYRQSEKLLPAIVKLLGQKKFGEIKTIVAVSGPGPFSALRIGLATANTLAFSLNIPIAGIKLEQLNRENDFVTLIVKLAAKARKGKIIEPFYGKEPNITLKVS